MYYSADYFLYNLIYKNDHNNIEKHEVMSLKVLFCLSNSPQSNNNPFTTM